MAPTASVYPPLPSSIYHTHTLLDTHTDVGEKHTFCTLLCTLPCARMQNVGVNYANRSGDGLPLPKLFGMLPVPLWYATYVPLWYATYPSLVCHLSLFDMLRIPLFLVCSVSLSRISTMH
jgi:hypothetical protein